MSKLPRIDLNWFNEENNYVNVRAKLENLVDFRLRIHMHIQYLNEKGLQISRWLCENSPRYFRVLCTKSVLT